MAIQPINYRMDVLNPLQEAMRGYESLQVVRAKNQEMQKNEIALRQQAQIAKAKKQAQERLIQMQTDIDRIVQLKNSGQPVTPEQYEQLFLKYPGLEEKLKESYKNAGETEKQNLASQYIQVASSLENDNKERAVKLATQYKEAAENSGNTVQAQRFDSILKQIEKNPKGASIAPIMDLKVLTGEDFSDTIKNLRKNEESYSVLSSEDKKSLGLDENKQYQISSSGKITSIGGGGVTVNVGDDKMIPEPPKDWAYVPDESSPTGFRAELIPNSETWKKAQEISKKGAKTQEVKATGQSAVLNSISDLIEKVDNAPWFSPVTGVTSELAKGLRQNKVDADNMVKTIKANIGFDRLQQMREASRTGGALGAVSERELDTLQAVLGSLDTKQSKDQFKKNVEFIKSVIEKDEQYRKRIKGQMQKNIESDADLLDFYLKGGK